jgi:hypothetical protein
MKYIKHLDELKENIFESIRLLLEYGADPNYYGETKGISPLLLALNYKLRDVVDLLLRYGAKPTERMVQITLDRYQEYNPQYGIIWQSELHQMAYNGYADLLMPYIERKEIDPYTMTPDRRDYFCFVAQGGSAEMLIALLPLYKPINAQRYRIQSVTGEIRAMTLIFAAAWFENLEAVKILLGNGANPDIPAYREDGSEIHMTDNTSPDVLQAVVDFKLGRKQKFAEYRLETK